MKHILLFSAFILLVAGVFAQSPQEISYQAIIRDAENHLVIEQVIGMQISILQGTADGTEVYIETQTPETNANGLISIEIGSGTILSGDFAAIDWATGPYFIKTEVDPEGGEAYSITGVSQILSVPYAIYADKAGNTFSGNYNELTNQPDFTEWDTNASDDFSGSFNDLTNIPANIDTDVTDDFSGDYNDLTNQPDFTGWDTNTSDDFSGSYNDLSDVPVNMDTDATDDFDGDYTNLSNTPDFSGWDTNASDDFSGSFNDLSNTPLNLDIDATDDFTGNYNDLTNKPDFTNWDTNIADDFSGSYNDLTDIPANIDTDVTDDFSGDYNDLTNQPNFTGWDTNTSDDFSGSYNDLSDVPANMDTDATDDFDGQYSSLSGSPTNVSDFTNDLGYLTTEIDGSTTNEIQTLAQVLTENNDAGSVQIKNVSDPTNNQDVATKAYVDQLIKIFEGNGMLVVDFTASENDILLTDTIYFTGNSAFETNTWFWDFGDGTTSTEQNPMHIYQNTGTYTVSLTAVDNVLNPQKTKTNYILVTTPVFGTFTDSRDGTEYQTVSFGENEWMAENLKYLPSVSEMATYSSTTPCYYVSGYDGTNTSEAKATANYSTYGVLYNWNAAMAGAASSTTNPSGVQGVCPEGWHLPSNAEWTELTDYFGGEDVAGAKLKESGITHWNSPNTGATNHSGFSALPGGGRYNPSSFLNLGLYGYWWTSTSSSTSSSWRRAMEYNSDNVVSSDMGVVLGFSVRCKKD